ncbi:MAG: hypothetical protein E7660_04850 [Ruminococcaceae bacterium]|nr:hypothetical protein [Oscillospiraceae bacterium]
MKNKKLRLFALMICVIMCAVTVLTSCAGGSKEYKITVKDAMGTPYGSGIVVQLMKNGEKAGMQACNESGEALITLPAGEYGVKLAFTDSEAAYHYNEELTVSAKEPELEVIMAKKVTGEAEALTAKGEEHDAYAISEGCTYVELEGERSYLLYTPKTAGNYKFSVIEGDASIGYYGAPHFVQENNLSETVDGAFTISISASMIGTGGGGTSVFVLGLDKAESESCVVVIERIGDALKTIEDEPWTIYKKTVELKEYVLPEGYKIGEFDLTAATDAYKFVMNEKDGFYHLDSADGPLVLVRLAEDCDYIACFKTILDRSGVSRYFFKEDGTLEEKVSYSECLLEYIDYVDEKEGVYPLTEDLKHIIQQRGEYVGWWDVESAGYIFKDENNVNISTINPDIAWLLMCCYLEG